MIFIIILLNITLTSSVPTLISYQGKLNNATTGDPFTLASLRINITSLNNLSDVVWNNTFENVTDQFGVFSLVLGRNITLNLTPGRDYQLVVEVDLDSASFTSANMIFGDLDPSGDNIRVNAGGPSDATELLLTDNTTTVQAAIDLAIKNNTDASLSNVSISGNLTLTGNLNLTTGKINCNIIDGGTDTDFCADADADTIFSDTGITENVSLNLRNNTDAILKTLNLTGDLNVSGNVNFTQSLSVLGNVGIGTTSPANLLDVNGSANFNGSVHILDRLNFTGGAAGQEVTLYSGVFVSASTLKTDNIFEVGTSVLLQPSGLAAFFEDVEMTKDFTVDGGTLHVDSNNSKVGIGTTAPGNKLQVNDDVADFIVKFVNDGNLANRNGIEVKAGLDDATGVTRYFEAQDGDGSIIGYIENNAGTFQLVDSSDQRLKEDIAPTQVNGTAVINSIEVKEYRHITGSSNQSPLKPIGLVAQDLLEMAPWAVNEMYPTETGPAMLGIALQRLTPVLIKALQETNAQLEKEIIRGDDLEQELNNIQTTLNTLKQEIEILKN